MSIASIQKIWAMIGAVIIALNASWIPDIVKGVFEPEATELIFTAIGAVVAVWQFVKSRTNPNPTGPEPEALTKPASIMYTLNPFKSAA